MKLCPECNNEILPYLKTGEVKRIFGSVIASYQLHYCLVCKTVYYEEYEKHKFIKLEEKKNAPTDKGNKVSS